MVAQNSCQDPSARVILGAILALPSYLSYDHYIVFTNIDSFAISHLVATPFSPATHRYNTLRGQRGPRGIALRAPLLMIGTTTSLPLHARRQSQKTTLRTRRRGSPLLHLVASVSGNGIENFSGTRHLSKGLGKGWTLSHCPN